MKLLTVVLGLTLIALPALADDTKGPPRPTAKEKGACNGTATAAPGSSATNNDGVQVTNKANSNGDINLTPKTGTANCASLVNMKAGASGTATGLDGNDTALVAANSNATISGTGGTVSVSAGCTVLVVNVGGPGAGNMVANYSGGPSIIGPGQSLLIHT